MEDKKIIHLFWSRSEAAIAATAEKYGPYCHAIAFHILGDQGDSEECVNDTYLGAWNAIPPQRPQKLRAFLGRLTRNLALNRWERYHAEKRGRGRTAVALEELRDCVPAPGCGEQLADRLALAEVLNRFLGGLPAERRKIFMRRYWYMDTVREIAEGCSMGESAVKMSLLRSRNELKELLEKEGLGL